MDRLTALKVFRAIVFEGSFAAAGRRLGLSPAAISKNVAELEASLGARLLNRTTRRLSLTDAGQLYADRVGRILEDLEEADRTLAKMSGEVSGLLRVGAPHTIGLLVLSPAVPVYLQRYPGVTLELDLDDRRIDMVGDGLDIVLRGSPALEDSRLIARKVASLRYVVCASPDYLKRHGAPERPEAVREHDLIQFSLPRRGSPWTFERGGERIEVSVRARYAVNSSLAIRDALNAGLGIARIPELYVREQLSTGRLIDVLPDWSVGSFDLFAAYPSRQCIPPKISAFLQFMVDIFQSIGDSPAVTPA